MQNIKKYANGEFLSLSLSLLFSTLCHHIRCVQSAAIAMAVCVRVLSVRFKQKLNCVSNAYAYMFCLHICVGGDGGVRDGKCR